MKLNSKKIVEEIEKFQEALDKISCINDEIEGVMRKVGINIELSDENKMSWIKWFSYIKKIIALSMYMRRDGLLFIEELNEKNLKEED